MGSAPDQQIDQLDCLAREIGEHRQHIDETVQALRKRLSPFARKGATDHRMKPMHSKGSHGDRDSQWWEQDRARHGGRYDGSQSNWSSNMSTSLRDHPVVATLVGVGVGYLLLRSTGYDRRIAHSDTMRQVRQGASSMANTIQDRASEWGEAARDTVTYAAETARSGLRQGAEAVRDVAEQAYERTTGAAGEARDQVNRALDDRPGGSGYSPIGDRARNMAHDVGERAGQWRNDAERKVHHMSRDSGISTTRMWEMVDEHPLVVGLVGLAVGAAIGASLPRTRTEHRLVGDYADEAQSRARRLAHDAWEGGSRAARAAVDAARDEISEFAESTADTARDGAERVSDKMHDTMNRARDASRDARSSARDMATDAGRAVDRTVEKATDKASDMLGKDRTRTP